MTPQSPQTRQTPQSIQAAQEDIQRDLQASLEARRELGPEYDQHFLDALVEKLTRQAQPAPPAPVARGDSSGEALALAICSLIFGIPIVAIAGSAGLPALIIACAMILGVNVAFNLKR